MTEPTITCPNCKIEIRRYVLISHDEIAENIMLAGLAARFGC